MTWTYHSEELNSQILLKFTNFGLLICGFSLINKTDESANILDHNGQSAMMGNEREKKEEDILI